jgi:hypothetical protein
MCANDVGRYGVELQTCSRRTPSIFGPAMGLLSLSHLRLAVFFVLAEKDG